MKRKTTECKDSFLLAVKNEKIKCHPSLMKEKKVCATQPYNVKIYPYKMWADLLRPSFLVLFFEASNRMQWHSTPSGF